jgi:hypothetical protein
MAVGPAHLSQDPHRLRWGSANEIQQQYEHGHREQHCSRQSSEKSHWYCRCTHPTSLAMSRSPLGRHRGIELGPDGVESEQAGVVRRRFADGIPTPTFCTHVLSTLRGAGARPGGMRGRSPRSEASPIRCPRKAELMLTQARRSQSARAVAAPAAPATPTRAAAAGLHATGDTPRVAR